MIDFIKDADCTKETPVKLGVPDAPIYGKGIKLKPRVDGRTDSEHFKKIYLPELLPLEEYDGEPVTWVCPELERRISEALAVDERITGVTDFEFDLTVKGVVHAYFTVKTIYGDIKAEKGVKI